MGNVFISIIFTLSACTWIYTKFQRSSGNNTKQSITAVAVIGVVLFLGMWLALHSFLGGK